MHMIFFQAGNNRCAPRFFLTTIFIFFTVIFKGQNNRLWATYYGDAGMEEATFVATDASNNVYISGFTTSTTNIASGGFQNVYGGSQDAFLVKFDANGNRLWSTYYGDAGGEWGNAVAVDAAGNVYLTGTTTSTTGIASGGFQNTWGGNADAFLVKFDANGNRLWSTYYGGNGDDVATCVTTDAAGNVFIAGVTSSTSAIASGGFQNVYAGIFRDAFLAKFDANGNRLWGTYYGGTGEDDGMTVTTDPSGNSMLAGITNSTTAIASGGFLNAYAGGIKDAFLVKFDPAGNRLWGTYYGDAAEDRGTGLATDASGNIYLAGETNSTAGIAAGGYQNTYGGSLDAFLVKFNPAGGRTWATYYGSSDVEEGYSVAVDALGNPYLGGDSYSTNGVSASGFQSNLIGTENEMVVKFDPLGNRLCATYYGQSHDEDGRVAVDAQSNVYLVGYTISSSGIASGGFQNTYGGSQDGYLVKFSSCANNFIATATSTNLSCNGQCNGTATASPLGGIAPYSYSWNTNPPQTSVTATGLCAGTYTVIITDANGDTTSATATITQPPPFQLTGTTVSDTCGAGVGCASVTVNGGSPGYTYVWSSGGNSDTLCNLVAGTYAVVVTDTNGCADTLSITVGNTGAVSADAGSTVTITQGQSTVLNATGGNSYSWSPPGGLSCTNCASPTASPTQTTTYTVTVTNSSGCSATDTVTVFVEYPCGELFVPNAFSPNDDQHNDVLYVRGNCIRSLHFEVYSRWGERVFQTDTTTIGWDGTFRGQECNTAVFVYWLRATLNDGSEVMKKGDVSLVR